MTTTHTGQSAQAPSTADRTAGAAPTPVNRYPFIDALRGWAILGVIIVHVSQQVELPPRLHLLLHQGATGVQLFFIASALTLCLSLAGRSKHEQQPVRNFFIRRIFRIMPLFYAGMLFFLLTRELPQGHWWPQGISLANIVATATFTNGWNAFWINNIVPGGWSIAVEMAFYLLVPLLYARLTSARAAAGMAVVTLAVSAVLHQAIMQRYTGHIPIGTLTSFLSYWLPGQLPVFALGFVLFHWLRADAATPTPPRWWQQPLLLLALSGLLLALAVLKSHPWFPSHLRAGLAYLLFAYLLAKYPWRLFVNRAMCYLGTISYSGYITHFIVIGALSGLVTTRLHALPATAQLLVLFVLVLAVTVALATVTYHLIEVPGQRLGRRLITWLEGRDAVRALPAGIVVERPAGR